MKRMKNESISEMTREEIEDQNYEVLYETDEEFNNRNNKQHEDDYMKTIKVFGASEAMCMYDGGNVVMLTNTSHDHHENEEMFTLNDPKEIYEIYQLLKEADSKGAFDMLEDDVFFEHK